MKIYIIYADSEEESIRCVAADHRTRLPAGTIERYSSSAAYRRADELRAFLGPADAPFETRVERALAHYVREVEAVWESISSGEATSLPIEARRHAACCAAVAARPSPA